MNENINIEFSDKDFELIMKYANLIEADTVQAAIMNAISIALDNKEMDH